MLSIQGGRCVDTVNASNQLIQVPADAVAMMTCVEQGADIIAKVNGKPISQSRLGYLMKSRSAQGHQSTNESMNHALDMLISQEVLYQEAVKLGYERNPDVAMQIEISKEEAVIDAYLLDYAKNHPIGEDMLKQEYECQMARAGDKEYKVRHILLDSEDEALRTLAELESGASFEVLAAQLSVDARSKLRGGELEWTPAVDYLPAFRDALAGMEKGQTTAMPVQTEFGWHVIRVDDERQLRFPAFDEVKPNIYQGLQRRAVDEIIAELRAKAEIE